MMERYRAYSEYKDSSQLWLGQIPAHWKIQYSKWLFTERNTKASRDDEMLTASQKHGVIPQKMFMRLEQQKVVQVFKGHDILKRAEKNDFVISMRSFQGGIEYCNYSGAISSAYVPLIPQDHLCPSFYKYFLKSQPYIQALQATTNLVRDGQALRYNNFIQVRLPVLPFEEADQISKFLDHETAKIDTLIEKQKKLIELLKEKRQAVINHAVTKGLNPDVKMKDSEVEWLGDVPEHWIVRRLKHAVILQSGIAKGKDLTGKTNIIVPMLRVANVQDGYLNLDDVHNIKIEPDQLERYQLQYGDMLMNEGGDNDKLGRGAIWRSAIEPCIHQNHVFAIRPHGIESEWLEIITQTSYAKFYFYRTAKQSTNLASISSGKILELPVLIPPEEERAEIVQYIADKTKLFEAAGGKAGSQIKLLQERRSALISAAVTGKIDVRNWQPPTQNTPETEKAA